MKGRFAITVMQIIPQKYLPSKERLETLYIPAVIVLVAATAFGLGRLSKIEEMKPKLVIRNGLRVAEPAAPYSANTGGAQAAAAVNAGPRNFVASKSGTKYYLPACSGAKSIKEENKVWFATAAEAQAAGYAPAANCKGL